MIGSWKQKARSELIALREGLCAWSYRRSHDPGVEPTVLACLGLLASGGDEPIDTDIATARRAAEWLATIQRPDGSLAATQGFAAPGWPTPYALMLWSTLAGNLDARHRACDWLLAQKGVALPRESGPDGVIGHDPGLVGWPWVAGTHSWLEPTALSILALCHQGFFGHPRVSAGVKVILDRALEHGGWNCGNKSVFGTELRPQPGADGAGSPAPGSRGERVAGGRARGRLSARDTRRPASRRVSRMGRTGPSGPERPAARGRDLARGGPRPMQRQA